MNELVTDACCLLNLFASGKVFTKHSGEKMKTNTKSFEKLLYVPATVVSEAMFVYGPDADDSSQLVKCELNIDEAIAAGELNSCKLQDGDESALFVQLAVRLDDGEAACLAIAKIRSWMLATDDRVARNLAAELDVPTITTPELVKEWAETTGANYEQIAVALSNIQRFAKFVPRRGTPSFDWWDAHS